MAIHYRHKKTGNIYVHLAYGTDCTDGERDGTRVVIYRPAFNWETVYVRLQAEHDEKFEVLPDGYCSDQGPTIWSDVRTKPTTNGETPCSQ